MQHSVSKSEWKGSALRRECTLQQLAPYIGKLKTQMAAALIKRYSRIAPCRSRTKTRRCLVLAHRLLRQPSFPTETRDHESRSSRLLAYDGADQCIEDEERSQWCKSGVKSQNENPSCLAEGRSLSKARKRYSAICTRCAATVVVCRSCRKRRISFSTAFRVCESVAGCLGRVQKWDKQQQRQTQGAPHATSYQCDLSLPRQQRRSSDMPQLRRQAHTDSSSWRCETSEGVSLLENRPSEIPRGRHLLPLLLQFKQTNPHRFA